MNIYTAAAGTVEITRSSLPWERNRAAAHREKTVEKPPPTVPTRTSRTVGSLGVLGEHDAGGEL